MGKHLIRLLTLPVVIVLTVLEWGGAYILPAIKILCRLISGTILILTAAACLTGMASGNQAVNTFVTGFIFYLIPRIGEIMISSAALVNIALSDWIKS